MQRLLFPKIKQYSYKKRKYWFKIVELKSKSTLFPTIIYLTNITNTWGLVCSGTNNHTFCTALIVEQFVIAVLKVIYSGQRELMDVK